MVLNVDIYSVTKPTFFNTVGLIHNALLKVDSYADIHNNELVQHMRSMYLHLLVTYLLLDDAVFQDVMYVMLLNVTFNIF